MIREKILEFLANNWPSPLKKNIKELGEHLNSDEYNFNYALKKQFLFKVNNGFPYDFFEKEVLEIGCGQGGISTYLALNGAKNVIGIDINKEHILSGQKFINRMEEKLEVKFQDRLRLIVEDAGELSFKDNSFDIIIADNVFEHFMDTEKILSEAYRVLNSGGELIIPSFNSIYSKYGAHLKYGLKMPWVNVLFSEKTICKTLQIMARKNPSIYIAYPGLKDNVTKIKDLRPYKDLAGMTHQKFIEYSQAEGFKVKSFSIIPPFGYFTTFFRLLYKIPVIKSSIISDILSRGARCVLVKESI